MKTVQELNAIQPIVKNTVNELSTTNNNDSYMDRDDQMILNLLSAIENEPNTTQKDLATRLGVAVGVVNSYVKRIIYKGYVKTLSLQRRRLRYLITPSGIKEKSRLTFEFLQYSYVYIRKMRQKTREILSPLAAQGKKRVVFYGSGEVAELAYLAVRELGLILEGIVDRDRVGDRCIDQIIRDLNWLEEEGKADAILVLKSLSEDRVLEQHLKNIAVEKKMELIVIFP